MVVFKPARGWLLQLMDGGLSAVLRDAAAATTAARGGPVPAVLRVGHGRSTRGVAQQLR